MSSFDVLAGPREQRPGAFSPLCPAGRAEAGASAAQAWRPLFDDPARADAPIEAEPAQSAGAGEGSSDSPTGEPMTSDATQAFAAGYEQGQRETRALVEEAAAGLARSVDAVMRFRRELEQRYERELLGVALAVARKVVHAEVSGQPELWLSMIREAVQRIVNRETVRIRVPASLAAFLTEHLPDLRARLDGVQDLEVVEDPALADGACVVDTLVAELDVGIDAQLDEIARALTPDPT